MQQNTMPAGFAGGAGMDCRGVSGSPTRCVAWLWQGLLLLGLLAGALVGPGHHQHDFALLLVWVTGHPVAQRGQRGAAEGFKGFGQFAAQRGLTVRAEAVAQVLEHGGNAVRGFIKNQRGRLRGQLVQPRLTACGFGR